MSPRDTIYGLFENQENALRRQWGRRLGRVRAQGDLQALTEEGNRGWPKSPYGKSMSESVENLPRNLKNFRRGNKRCTCHHEFKSSIKTDIAKIRVHEVATEILQRRTTLRLLEIITQFGLEPLPHRRAGAQHHYCKGVSTQ